MESAEEIRQSDAAELQNVLTRYVDSHVGYLAAAESVDNPGAAAAFKEIAERRREIVDHVSTLIDGQGEEPDTSGSAEGTVHRWWLRVRSALTNEELHAILVECVRGEKELARTIRGALDHGGLDNRHAEILATVNEELQAALQTFETVIND